VRTEIEHLVLNALQHLALGTGLQHRRRHADRAIGLVHVTDRSDTRIRLADARPVDQPGLPRIAGAGIDLVELDHQPAWPRATSRNRITNTTASAWNWTRRHIMRFCWRPDSLTPSLFSRS